MLNRKAFARAIRGHLLVDAALNALLMCKTFDLPFADTTDLDSEALETQNDQVDLEEEEETIEGLRPMDKDLELTEVPGADLEVSRIN